MFGLFKKKKTIPSHQGAVDRIRRDSRSSTSVSAPSRREQDGGDDFALSMAVGMATDNALLGYAAGGSLSGGLIGSAMSESTDDHLRGHISSHDTGTSATCDVDSSSSYDSGSSFDSGSCGGSSSDSW